MLARINRFFDFIGMIILLLILLTGSVLILDDPTEQVRRYTRLVEFDYFDWTMEAIGVNLAQGALGNPYYFNKDERHQVVVDYMHLLDQIFQAEYQLNLIYTDPAIPEPETASAKLRSELNSLYKRQQQLMPIAEAILEAQVSTVLADLDLTTGGQPIPPVLFHFTGEKYNLVVSPRDEIRQEESVSILPELSVDQHAALEAEVDSALDVSSLVVPVGGIGTYPTMVIRSTALTWLTDTIAHEWIHNYLTFRPLGFNYSASPELRTMNETTASIAGTEIGAAVIRRYYPELAAEYGIGTPEPIGLPADHADPEDVLRPFDFRAEMHTTRITVDALLEEGRIEEAEAYMESRRQFFWDHGYAIRKLNQAYFAFYGAYADIPGGAAGEDPVGPAVRALRAQSASLAEFIKQMSKMSTFEELLAVVSP